MNPQLLNKLALGIYADCSRLVSLAANHLDNPSPDVLKAILVTAETAQARLSSVIDISRLALGVKKSSSTES